MKILIEASDKNFLSDQGLREMQTALIRSLNEITKKYNYKRGLADFDLQNNTLIVYNPDIIDMQKAEEKFEQKWLIREAKMDKEDNLEEFIEN